MKNKFVQKTKRLLSGIVSTVIAVSMLPTLPATAEEAFTDYDYYMSLDPNGEEYQEWKANYALNTTSENAVSTFSVRSSANGISNDYIEITLNGSRYTLGTTGGNPDSTTDNNKRMLYGYPSGGTSYTTVQIDGTNYTFTPETTTYRDNSIISTDVIGDVVVTQYLNIVSNQYTNRDDVAEFFYTVENTGENNHNVGVRIMFDTMLGGNDSAPFRLPEIGDVTTETDLKGSAVPEFWQAFDSLTSPSVIAQGTLNIDKDSTPDRVRFTNWGTASSNAWDYSRSAGSANGDSAVCLYWNPKSLGTNETLSCKTYYGLSSLQQDNAPPLAIALSGATKLEIVEDENGIQSYSPNPFTVTAYIQNIGTGTAYNTNVELVLPEGMNVVDGDNIVSLGDVPVSNRQTQVSWKVEVEPSPIDKTEIYGIIVTADNAETKTLEREIEIPALAENSVELWLDRSVITDSTNLNLKFKIKNTSDSPIALNQICPRYYYIDESPKATKQFNCYSVHMSSPYAYLSNTAVTMSKHELEALYDNATHYFEFSFDSDKELQPNQEIIVNAGINNLSWTKIVSSNDYSAVGDDSLASGNYELWEYMPVFSSSNSDKPIWGIVPEFDTDGMEPDLLVELDPNAVNGKGYMNLNIRITNNGLLPVDLGQTEIKYYYTNDRGHAQSVAGNYIGGRIDNNFISITDKVSAETIKMDTRKKMADTYVSITFSEDTGILNFEDYIDLNIQVYNTGWKSGDYILENDHSYQEDEQEIQTFSLRARAASNTAGMREAKNIVVCSMFIPFFPPISTELLEYDFNLGIEPIELYEPTFSAFKVGWGNEDSYTNEDYESFVEGMEEKYSGTPYSDYATGSNLEDDFTFTQDNMNAILQSDVAYISGHGYFGGVIPISFNGHRGYENIPKVFVANNNVKNSQFTAPGYYTEFEMEGNTYSFKSGEGDNEDTSNLQWLIFSACSQLNDFPYDEDHPDDVIKFDDRYTYELWLDTLLSNSNMKGILGYYGDAPGASFDRSDSEVIERFLKYSKEENVYDAWMKANAFNSYIFFADSLKCSLLTKDDYADKMFYDTIIDTAEVKGEKAYLYKAVLAYVGNVEYKESLVFESEFDSDEILEAVAVYSSQNDIIISNNYSPVVREISRKVLDNNGECIGEELVEYTVSFVETSHNAELFSFNAVESEVCESVEMAFSYNPFTDEVEQL